MAQIGNDLRSFPLDVEVIAMSTQERSIAPTRAPSAPPRNIPVLACVISLLFPVAGLAEHPILAPQTQGSVSFVSGGVGQEEVCQIKAMKSDYNLHLMFSETPSNNYLAFIPVRIFDAQGTEVLSTTSDGPYLYARLSPGNYRIIAENEDRSISRSVHIGKGRAASVQFAWKGKERPRLVRVDTFPHC